MPMTREEEGRWVLSHDRLGAEDLPGVLNALSTLGQEVSGMLKNFGAIEQANRPYVYEHLKKMHEAYLAATHEWLALTTIQIPDELPADFVG